MKGGYEGAIKMHNSKQFLGNPPMQSRLNRNLGLPFTLDIAATEALRREMAGH
jgi:hypothetical protein